MSLEAVIAENTAAMRELTALLKGGAIAPAAQAEDLRNDPEAVKPEEPAKAAGRPKKTEKPVEPPKAEEPAPEAPAPEPEAPAEEAPAITYADVAKAVTALAMRSRAKAAEVLAGFKLKHASEAKPEQWPAIKAAMEETLAGMG